MHLALDSISMRYGDVTAVDDLSLEVDRGELMTIIGPSGSGKSTILRIIAGLTKPDTGSIRLDGNLLDQVPPHRRQLAMVFQDYGLFPHMNVSQNVAFGLEMRKRPREETARRVRGALEMMRLDGMELRRPDQLSGGQRQRVALARALVIEPLVLLLDEPLTALDRKLREEMRQEIRQLHERLGVTTLLVTHDQDEALSLGDRIAVLNQGRLEQVGSPTDVYEHPTNPFVASFLGRANLLIVRVDEAQGGFVEADLSRGIPVRVPVDRDDLRPGDRVRLLVRPEHIRTRPADAGPTNGRLRCRVERMTYHGAGAYLDLRGPGDVVLTSYVAANEVKRTGIPPVGAEVEADWDEDAWVVLERIDITQPSPQETR